MEKNVSNLKYKSFLLVVLSVLLVITGCSKTKGGGAGEGDDAGLSESDLAIQRYGDGNIPRAEAGGMLEDVNFDYDSSTLNPQEHETLRKNAEILKANGMKAEIEGHCDKRGTNEYNLALGEERARAVAAALVSYGVPSTQLSIISYGEEIPLDPRDAEDAFAKNRRAHFATYQPKS